MAKHDRWSIVWTRVSGVTARIAAALATIAVSALFAQAIQPRLQTEPEFEVAIVKPNKSGPPVNPADLFVFSAGRLTATNVTLKELIRFAYSTRRTQMEGGPNWSDSDRFDVAAKADDNANASLETIRAMTRTLLRDRFKLAIRRETKPVQVYVLTVAKNGPKLRKDKEDAVSQILPGQQGQATFTGMTMAAFANTLSNFLNTPVLDETGLDGAFSFSIDVKSYAPRQAGAPQFGTDILTDDMLLAVEQLGLNLTNRAAPLEFTIIEHAEKPAGEN